SGFRRLVALHLHHTTSPCSSLSPHVVFRPNGRHISSTSPSPRTRSVERLSLVFPKSGAEPVVPGSGFGSLQVCGSSRADYFNFLVSVGYVYPMRLSYLEGVHFAYVRPVCDAVVGKEVLNFLFFAAVH